MTGLLYLLREKPANASEATADIVDWMQQRYAATDSGIIYCQTRKDCETLASELAEHGMLAAYYHAEMDPATREGVHLQWSKGVAPTCEPPISVHLSGTCISTLLMLPSQSQAAAIKCQALRWKLAAQGLHH